MKITSDYIRGLVEGEGYFTFCKSGPKYKIPTFGVEMHYRDKKLLEAVRDYLLLGNKIYTIDPVRKSSIGKSVMARLMVRDIGSLKNKIVPFFYNKLIGHKNKQFFDWLERIGADPEISPSHGILYRLHKSGYWEKKENLIYDFLK